MKGSSDNLGVIRRSLRILLWFGGGPEDSHVVWGDLRVLWIGAPTGKGRS